ncbi:MAG: SDR family NAD(P)-dependent oxidoreductase [Acidimicrobiaceae bacterium]|nr:SDR family NAD(P)-dependent oxidoreductase [Acidimicrobiaceae bacterium]
MDNAFSQPQTVVVLGGSSDIARAITRKLCAERTRTVVLAGRDGTLLERAAEEARDFGATKCPVVLFDATDPLGAEAAVDQCFEAAGGQVDLVIVAVGLLGNQERDQVDVDATLAMMNVNFTWPVAALTRVRTHLLDQGRGRILVISSVASVRVRASAYLYGGAKAGLDRLAGALADSLRGTGVQLQLLRPGVVRTRMTEGLAPAPFTTGVNEVADVVMKGLADGRPVIWSPPLLRYVFTALRHLPGPLWRMVMDR